MRMCNVPVITVIFKNVIIKNDITSIIISSKCDKINNNKLLLSGSQIEAVF